MSSRACDTVFVLFQSLVIQTSCSQLTVVSLKFFYMFQWSIQIWRLLIDDLTIIEVDGVNVSSMASDLDLSSYTSVQSKPLVVDSIQIFVGQRYSIILHANQPVSNYWIRADPNSGTTGFDGGLNSAILRYLGAPIADPASNQTTSIAPLVETNLHNLVPSVVPGAHVPGGADVNLNLNLLFDFTTLRFTVNGASFVPPTVPVLLQILSGAQTAQDLLPPGSVYTLPPNKSIEISIPGGTAVGGPVSVEHEYIYILTHYLFSILSIYTESVQISFVHSIYLLIPLGNFTAHLLCRQERREFLL